jgi:hypothetical protein
MEIEVGDLVRVRGDDWLQKPFGIVTQVRLLTVESTGDQYTAVTALVGSQYVTFGTSSFELINKAERKDS